MTSHRVTTAALADMLRNRAHTAVAHGFLTLLDEALELTGRDVEQMALARAARPLCDALKAPSVRQVAAMLASGPRRIPREVTRLLGAPDLIAAFREALDALGLDELTPGLDSWAIGDHRGATLPMYRLDDVERRELVDALLLRTEVIRQAIADRSGGFRWSDVPPIDGRMLKGPAAGWQMVQITGEGYPPPRENAARYPNRVGRNAAVLAFARMRAALQSPVQPPAEDDYVVDPILLLIAVAEAVAPDNVADPNAIALAMQGRLRPRIRSGAPQAEFLVLSHVWAVLNEWGNPSRKLSSASPSAWNLSQMPVWADVVVWALCSAAARLVVASEYQTFDSTGLRTSLTWPQHVEREWPKWLDGAESAWKLMQSGRAPIDRTAFPGRLVPDLRRTETWPWRKQRDPWADDEDDSPDTDGATVTPIGSR